MSCLSWHKSYSNSCVVFFYKIYSGVYFLSFSSLSPTFISTLLCMDDNLVLCPLCLFSQYTSVKVILSQLSLNSICFPWPHRVKITTGRLGSNNSVHVKICNLALVWNLCCVVWPVNILRLHNLLIVQPTTKTVDISPVKSASLWKQWQNTQHLSVF